LWHISKEEGRLFTSHVSSLFFPLARLRKERIVFGSRYRRMSPSTPMGLPLISPFVIILLAVSVSPSSFSPLFPSPCLFSEGEVSLDVQFNFNLFFPPLSRPRPLSVGFLSDLDKARLRRGGCRPSHLGTPPPPPLRGLQSRCSKDSPSTILFYFLQRPDHRHVVGFARIKILLRESPSLLSLFYVFFPSGLFFPLWG